MFSSLLAVKPLLIAVGILSLLLSLSATLNVRQWKQIGAARAECEVTRLEDSGDRSKATSDAAAESLRNQVTQLENELKAARDQSKVIERRHSENSLLLGEFRKQLNDARKADPSLDQPADTTRLRALEDAYRIRTEGNSSDSVPSNP